MGDPHLRALQRIMTCHDPRHGCTATRRCRDLTRHGPARPCMGDPSSHKRQRIMTRHDPCHRIDNSSQLSTPERPVGFLGGIIDHRLDDVLTLSMRGRPP